VFLKPKQWNVVELRGELGQGGRGFFPNGDVQLDSLERFYDDSGFL